MGAQIMGIIKAIVCGRKIGQEPTRNTDMVKSYEGNEFVHRYVFK